MEAIKKRVAYIDIAKCLAIIMVVWGHTATNAELTSDAPRMLYKVLYSTHMPLFFILSGLSMSLKMPQTKGEWRYFLHKNVLTIAVPFVIWGAIYSTFTWKNMCYLMYGSWEALGKISTLTSLWYLSCLLVARVMVELILTFIPQKIKLSVRNTAIIFAIICVIIAVLLPKIEIGYPWCFNIAFLAVTCILIGVALKEKLLKISEGKVSTMVIGMLICLAIYMILLLTLGDDFVLFLMASATYGKAYLSIPMALAGSGVIIFLAMMIARFGDKHFPDVAERPLLYLGQHTMGIFIIHKPLQQQVVLPLMEKLIGGAPYMLVTFITAIISIVISMVLCWFIEYYIPELIGVFSKEKINGDAF